MPNIILPSNFLSLKNNILADYIIKHFDIIFNENITAKELIDLTIFDLNMFISIIKNECNIYNRIQWYLNARSLYKSLSKYRDSYNYNNEENEEYSVRFEGIEKYINGDVINLNRITSQELKMYSPYIVEKEFVSIVENTDMKIRNRIIVFNKERSNMKHTQYTIKLVNLFPNCQIVNLKNNNIDNVEYVENILEKCSIDYLVITRNPVVCFTFSEWYKNLSIEYLKKLIWIPKQWLNRKDAINICGVEKIDIVKKVHEEFYNSWNI